MKHFAWIEKAYQYYNKQLFYSKLPPCIFTIGEYGRAKGYMIRYAWSVNEGEQVHQISLTKSLFDWDHISIFATLVHEMVHLWQAEYGKPSINNYHNKEWGWKMKDVGLIPSDTGAEGGEEVGEKVSHYIEEGGRFQQAFERMPKNYFPKTTPGRIRPKISGVTGKRGNVKTPLKPTKGRTNKLKYECPSCNQKAYGGKSLSIICGRCNLPMTTQQ